jgi:hypothetical protein
MGVHAPVGTAARMLNLKGGTPPGIEPALSACTIAGDKPLRYSTRFHLESTRFFFCCRDVTWEKGDSYTALRGVQEQDYIIYTDRAPHHRCGGEAKAGLDGSTE